VFTDEAAMDTHRATPHFAARRAVADALDGPYDVIPCRTIFPADREYWGSLEYRADRVKERRIEREPRAPWNHSYHPAGVQETGCGTLLARPDLELRNRRAPN
jgi:hypothetical protein